MKNGASVLLIVAACMARYASGCSEFVSVDGIDPDAGGDDTAASDARHDGEDRGDPDAGDEAAPDAALDGAGEAVEASDSVEEEESPIPPSCGFDYGETFVYPLINASAPPAAAAARAENLPGPGDAASGPDEIAHVEPPPESLFTVPAPGGGGGTGDLAAIVMPGYSDDMPLFERGADWTAERRCYETPAGVKMLTQPEAYDMVKAIAELTTGVAMRSEPEMRSVVGIRGAYPGTFAFNGNLPDRFNDTIVLLWIDGSGGKHVREFPVNTDTGAHDFGEHASSSLRPNRRYHYLNGWHRAYNALEIGESGYGVRDDANKNGYWDSDRNGWLPPFTGNDHDRTGSGHNIHMGSVDAPLGTAVIDNWSAGCQVIPGMANWTEFITNAWTAEGDTVDYFLVDVRDIDPGVWRGECAPDGTHACPFRIDSFPFSGSGDTSASGERAFSVYNCSGADESGAEVVYLFTTDSGGTVSLSIADSDAVDIDIHLLDADDANACLGRADISFSLDVWPGRYIIIADTYVAGGVEQSGPFTLDVSFP